MSEPLTQQDIEVIKDKWCVPGTIPVVNEENILQAQDDIFALIVTIHAERTRADSLALELEASKHNHRRDNAELLKQRDHLEAQCAEMRSAIESIPRWAELGGNVWRRLDKALSSSSGQFLLDVLEAAEGLRDWAGSEVTRHDDRSSYRSPNQRAAGKLLAALSRWKVGK